MQFMSLRKCLNLLTSVIVLEFNISSPIMKQEA